MTQGRHGLQSYGLTPRAARASDAVEADTGRSGAGADRSRARAASQSARAKVARLWEFVVYYGVRRKRVIFHQR